MDEVVAPSEYDWNLLDIVEQLIELVNDLRGRVTILEREVFNG